MPQRVNMSRGAFIPPMVHAWSMHGPFVEHACVPGHSHGLHNHPGGPQDDGTMPRRVTSSSSYSSSSEVKARNSEVQRVPGNGFSSCAVPTFSRVQGISNGGQNGFPERVRTEICTGTIPNTRVRTRGTEVWSSCGSEVCRMRRIELS